MQNPFRHRPEDDFGRRDRDEANWEGRDQRPDEQRSWAGADRGRSAEAWRSESPSRQEPYEPEHREMSGARGWGYGPEPRSDPPGFGPSGYRGRSYGQRGPMSYGQGGYRQDYAPPSQARQGGRGYGSPSGFSGDYATHGYAPGGQIWEGSGPGMGGQSHEHHDFEPDYLHWREQQLSNFDRDYSEWRTERRQKFSSDFDTWRRSRPEARASGHTPAENPIVGDISDGGDGGRHGKKT